MDRPGETKATDAISATRERFEAAVRRGDAARAGAVYATDATLLAPSSEPVSGRRSIERFWQAGIDAGIVDVALEPLTGAHGGALAYEVGRYALRLRAADGANVVERGAYVHVHAQQGDGSWRWAVEMFSPEAPPARSTTARSTGATSDIPKEEQ